MLQNNFHSDQRDGHNSPVEAIEIHYPCLDVGKPKSPVYITLEALVTSHLVVRGSDCSLISLVIYGNTGQFNIEVENNLEDLPTALNPVMEEPISAPVSFTHSPIAFASVEMKRFLQLYIF